MVSVQKKIQAGFGVALVFLLFTGATAWWRAQQNAEAFRAVEHSHRVLDSFEAILVQMLDTETRCRGFALSGDETYLQSYEAGLAAVQTSFNAAKQLTGDNPGQQLQLADIERLIQQKINGENTLIRLRRSGDRAGMAQYISSGRARQTMDAISKLILQMESAENQLLVRRAARAEDLSRLTVAITAFSSLLTFGMIALAGGMVQRDYQRRQEAELAMRRSEQKLAVTLDSIGDAVLATDAKGQVTRMNAIAEKLTGWTQAEALGRPIPDVFNIINEQTRQPAVVPIAKVLATGEIHGLANHTIVIARDGTERPIADSAAPIHDKDGSVFGVVLVFRDVTEERRAEEALRESARQLRTVNDELEQRVEQRTTEVRQALGTLDAIVDGAFVFDPENLRFIHVNVGAVRQSGYTREELLAMIPPDIDTQLDEPAYRRMLAPLRRGEKSVLNFESVHRRKDGGTLPVEINLQYVTVAGALPRFVALVRDVTERKKAEQLARRSQRLESIGTLASGVAHDLNNALSPITMGVELIKQQYPKESELLNLFQSCAKRSTDMVRQLLSFARGAEGKHIILQSARLVREMEKLLTGSFPKNIQLMVKFDPDLPTVLGDATQLHQVLLNLCVNARDAMPDGGTLSLEAHSREVDDAMAGSISDARPGRYVVLSVRDAGTGIPLEMLDRIFDPFFTTKGPEQGTGLGLATVMSIVKGHGGFLQVDSQPGCGSTFSVYLPAAVVSGDTEFIGQSSLEFRGQGETVLMVDDEAAVREMARMVFRRLNLKLLTANNGEEGLRQVSQHRAVICGVITDMHMPHMDGLAFVRALRQVLPGIPVAVASGRMEESVAEELKAMGVIHRLDKPFSEAKLVEVLKSFLRLKS